MQASMTTLSSEQVRERLRAGLEVALIDVREEDPFAQAHPLFAVQMSAGRIELEAPWRLPRRDVMIVVYDAGEGLAQPAARRLVSLGYSCVYLLEGGLDGWRDSGGELFRDVNVPSKAFGELVEHECHTPSLSAPQVRELMDRGENMVVLDARRFDEYATMSIPGGVSVPGAELALRVRDLAPDPATRVIVNCAGRTRSIIGTQSLVNAGIPNPVAALRNGTIGWTLAGLKLEHGQGRRFAALDQASAAQARQAAQRLADQAGAHRLDAQKLRAWAQDTTRTLYCWDVRSPEEYAQGHLPGFGHAPGGQLVQETDVYAAVRGARIALVDAGAKLDGTRAAMTAHWLAQMGWEVGWLTDADPAAFTQTGAWVGAHVPLPEVERVDPLQCARWIDEGDTVVIDVSTRANYARGHIAGAYWLLRTDLPQAVAKLAGAKRAVVVCETGRMSAWVASEWAKACPMRTAILAGGQPAWAAAGLALAKGDERLLSPPIDRYRRPYEGTDNAHQAMQAYLDWEFGLVAQLGRDGTHGFRVLKTR
jgi:rhodanese-related sulfurtransferase